MFRTAPLLTSIPRYLFSRRVLEKAYPFLKKNRRKSILEEHPELKTEIERIRFQVLGMLPPSHNNQRTGHRQGKKQLQAVYLNQYYSEHEMVDKYARKAIPGWKNAQQQRREKKLFKMRREGKGPPKKGIKKSKKGR